MTRTLMIIILIHFSFILYSQQSWQSLDLNDSIQPISILPISYDTIIVGIWPSGQYPHGGIYRTIDSGESWQFYEIEYGTWGVNSLLLGENGIIFSGTNWGIYKSESWGENWEKVLTISKTCATLEQLSPSTIFAGCEEYLLRSRNYGITWDTCLVLNQNTYINSILAVSDSLIYMAATSYTSNDGGLYVSHDGGDDWDRIGLIMFNIQSLAISPFNELYAGCWFVGLLKSVDNGVTWDTILPNMDAVSVISRGNEIFVGCAKQSFPSSGIFYSGDNGETWEDRTHNMTNKNIVQIAFSHDDFLHSLSRYENLLLGPPLNRSMNPVVGIHPDQTSDLNFIIYPNPSNSFINIIIPEHICDIYPRLNFCLYNTNGEIVSFDSLLNIHGSKVIKLNVSEFNPGLYIIKIYNKKLTYLNKILIL
ncbi:MAG: T9SS type A sorting domain-containing protein [Bacteroidetes bacterium]|nr:T9SS type A sorting domain-containing protein [Bacteroidota bacterium]